MSACPACETLPEPLSDRGVLYLAPPPAHSLERLFGFLRRSGLDVSQPQPGVVAITVPPRGLAKLGLDLADRLTTAELASCKGLVVPEGRAPGVSDFAHVEPLATLVGRIRGDWLRLMLAEERLAIHFQPIVPVEAPDAVFAYECLLRGRERNGALVPPLEMLCAAREAGLAHFLDRRARLAAFRAAAEREVDCTIFVNFSPLSIYDAADCLGDAMAVAAESRVPPERVVFEATEHGREVGEDHLQGILSFCRHSGCLVALDDFDADIASLERLAVLRPDFVKIGRELVRGVDTDAYRAQAAGKILDVARGLGVRVVMEGVETDGEWAWARSRGADYAQGFCFARPGDPPPEPVAGRVSGLPGE